jgi:hypothetical protein
MPIIENHFQVTHRPGYMNGTPFWIFMQVFVRDVELRRATKTIASEIALIKDTALGSPY